MPVTPSMLIVLQIGLVSLVSLHQLSPVRNHNILFVGVTTNARRLIATVI